MRFRRLLASGLVAASLAPLPAAATALFGVDYSGPGTGNLYDVNQATGAITAIGASGFTNVGDLTSDTRAGQGALYGVNIATNSLLKFDPVTGSAVVAAVMNSPDPITSIAFDPVSGKLYGNTTVGFGASFDALYEIDPVTGSTTFIGRILFQDVYALGFSQSGRLFGVSDATNQLIEINLGTGNGALIAGLQLGSVFDMASRPEDDVMFIADSGSSALWTIDLANGNVTNVGPYGPFTNVVGLAFAPVSVPLPGTLALFGIGVLGAALRRRSA